MSFTVQATIDGQTVQATAETAKEAFAQAIDWQTTNQFDGITITQGSKSFSITEFSTKMALAEITATERSFDSF